MNIGSVPKISKESIDIIKHLYFIVQFGIFKPSVCETNVTNSPPGTSKPALPVSTQVVQSGNHSTRPWHCETGKWGDNCEHHCNSICADNRCNKTTGQCFSCLGSYWGKFCDQTCSIDHCVRYGHCDQVMGPVCEMCENNKWGHLCDKDCPQNCDGSCQSTEECKTCRDGFWGKSCNVTCHSHCQSCDQDTGICSTCISGAEQFWGEHCENSCHIPHCAGPHLCTKADGPSCFRCLTGRWGSRCEHRCNERCHGECSMTNGACLVYSGSHTTKSHSKTSHQPPVATIKILQTGDQVSRGEVFGIAFGTSILVCLIMVTIFLMAYRTFHTRSSLKFQRQTDEL